MKKNMIIENLLQRRNELETIILETKKRLAKMPEGTVRIIKHHKGYQFYHRMSGADTSGVYLPVSERQKAVDLIQKNYDKQILKAAEKQSMTISRFLHVYNPNVLKEIYSSLSEPRKKYVHPVDISDEKYMQNWLQFEYSRKPFSEGTPEHYTSNGERVRSKSEVMIADALKNAGIPYRYECPLELGPQTIYPDFTILRMEDRKEIYWEHLGMMDDPEYCSHAMQRLRLYEMNRIYIGDELIITMETSRLPLNLALIHGLITTWFC